MALTGESTGRIGLYATLLREVVNYRDKLTKPAAGGRPWTFDPHAKEILRPTMAVAVYLALWMALQSTAPSLELLPREWTWNLGAGLSFGFLVGFGPAYGPVVFLAHLAPLLGDLGSVPLVWQTIAVAACNAVAYTLSAYMLRRAVAPNAVDLEERSALGLFVGLIPLASLMAALGSSVNPSLQLDVSFELLGVHALSNAMGLIAVAPFVLLLGIPALEALTDFSSFKRTAVTLYQSLGVVLQTGALLALSVATYAVALGPVDGDRFEIYLLLFAPFVAAGLRFGLPGLAGSFLVVGCARMAMTAVNYANEYDLRVELPVLAAVLSALVVAALSSDGSRQLKTIHRQAALMDTVGVATDRILGTTEPDTDVSEVLGHLLAEVGATRVYVFENEDDQNHFGHLVHYETWKPGASRDEHSERMLDVVQSALVRENREVLEQGQVVQYRTSDLEETDRGVLRALQLELCGVIPIFVDGYWWGCLGVDRSTNTRWTPYELSALKTTGRVLGALLAHANIEQQFRQLTGNIPVVFWIGDPNGLRKTYVSPAFEQIWGLSADLVRNNPQSWIGALHHEDYGRIREALPQQLTGDYDVEYRVVPPNGPTRWIRDTAFPVHTPAGKISRVVGIAQDITAQKQAEERLSATSFLLKSLIDNLRPGIIVEDQNRNLRHVNEAFCRTFHLEPPEELPCRMEAFLGSSPIGRGAEGMEQMIAAGQAAHGDEVTTEDGRIFSRDYTPLSFEDADGYHLWSYEDITDRKRSEQQIRASLKEKEILLKEIHHRVKNNLQVISSLLNLQASQISEESAVEAFRDSQSRVKAMAIVHEKLYQSSGLARIDFAAYVQEVTSHLLRSYHTHAGGARLKLDIEPLELSIDTAIPCGLIINELVSNSLKYAFPDGRSGEIRISLSQDEEDNCRMLISDDGIGFPTEKFVGKIDSLGLHLVKNLVSQLKGTVRYRNDNGAEYFIQFHRITNDDADQAGQGT